MRSKGKATKLLSGQFKASNGIDHPSCLQQVPFPNVKNVYEGIKIEGLKFTTKWIGALIAQTPEDFSFLEKDEFKLNHDTIDHMAFLTKLTKSAAEEKEKGNGELKLPEYDFMAVFTRRNLFSISEVNVSALGTARSRSICTPKSIGIINYTNFFINVYVTVHELAHTMNSSHDGKPNECKEEDYFLMAPELPMHIFNSSQHTFSNCSLSYFKDYVDQLDRNNSNCLTKDILLPNEGQDFNLGRERAIFHHLYPGQIYDLDEQCKFIDGPDSRYCGGKDQEICRNIACSKESKCMTSYDHRAMDGTTCSNGAWCLNGICTLDSRAPRAPERCVNGDNTLRESLCRQIIYENTDNCTFHKDKCCASCKGNRTHGGCQDTIDECASLEPRDCYSKYYATTCCETCTTLVQNPSDANCLYGDKGDSCSDIVPEVCHLSTRFCCQTCAAYFSSITSNYSTIAIPITSNGTSKASYPTSTVPTTYPSVTTFSMSSNTETKESKMVTEATASTVFSSVPSETMAQSISSTISNTDTTNGTPTQLLITTTEISTTSAEASTITLNATESKIVTESIASSVFSSVPSEAMAQSISSTISNTATSIEATTRVMMSLSNNSTGANTDPCKQEDFRGTLEFQGVWGKPLLGKCMSLVKRNPSFCNDINFQKFCCVSCSAVKVVKDDCESDDDVVSLQYFGRNFTCTRLVAYNPSLCVKQIMKLKCCKSCGHFTIKPLKLPV